jgi:hypothetical protein
MFRCHTHNRSGFGRIATRILGGLAIAVLVAGVFGILAQQLWNALMPGLFHLPALTWLQTVGILILSRLLLGHHGPHHGGGPWKKFGMPWHDRRRFFQWMESEGHAAFESWKERQPESRG